MKNKNNLIIIANAAFCILAPFTDAQCPQICDDNLANVAIGPGALSNDTGNFNTAVGQGALQRTTTGDQNVAVGEGTLYANTIGTYNTALGSEALGNNTTASYNTAVGGWSMVGTGSPSTGTYDTAVGAYSLENITTGSYNTATGGNALAENGSGSSNTADGYQALFSNTTGSSNVAIGYSALFFNKTGSFNTATGRGALYKNTASNNTATGYQALNKNTSGPSNTANGYQALSSNTTADSNTATGYQSLYHSTGIGNTANGVVTLVSNTTGAHNTALGDAALYENTIGSNNIAVGTSAGFYLTTGSNNIDIGHLGVNGESATTRVGTVGTQTNTYIAGISGVTVAGGMGVIVDSSGHLGTSTSSARYKENIQPMDKASEAILALHPVTFRYKHDLDPESIPQFGLVAEQVEKVDPELVARDSDGKPYSVRYEAVNAMLLNEFLKEHRKVEAEIGKEEALEKTVAQQEQTIEGLSRELQEQVSQMREVTAALTAIRSAPRIAENRER